MKRANILGLALAFALLSSLMSGSASLALEREERIDIIQACVEILPIKVDGGKVVDVPWAGSGTIVHPSGLILTNYHVVEETGEWDKLAVLITTRSDAPPEPAFLAEIAAKSPRLDLAVLRIVSTLDGDPIDPDRLGLLSLKLGDAGTLEVGDELNIFGYPTIGGETITFTQGRVAGFSVEDGVDYQRAWIKTDATISGGNSGGTAVDAQGFLVGIPTQAGSGNADYFTDLRPIQDTDGDGDVDEDDTPVPLGGFINALRPVNLAYLLIEAAQSGKQIETDPDKGGRPRDGSGASAPRFSEITFASQQNPDESAKDPGNQFPAGSTRDLFAYFDYEGMGDGIEFNYVWTLDEATAYNESLPWEWGEAGSFHLALDNSGDPMPEGEYTLVLGVEGQALQQGSLVVGEQTDADSWPTKGEDEGVTISGTIVDADTGRPIEGALIIALEPGVSVRQFENERDEALMAAYGETDRDGSYVIVPPLSRGESYGVVVGAQGYEMISSDDGWEIDDDTPDAVELDPIPLTSK